MPGETKPRRWKVLSKPMKRMNYKKPKEWFKYVS